jgi:hypothetical protein
MKRYIKNFLATALLFQSVRVRIPSLNLFLKIRQQLVRGTGMRRKSARLQHHYMEGRGLDTTTFLDGVLQIYCQGHAS